MLQQEILESELELTKQDMQIERSKSQINRHRLESLLKT